MKLNILNATNPKERSTAPTPLTAREQEVVAATGGVAGGVIFKNPNAA